MYNPDTELLFPIRVIPALKDLRDPEWSVLIEKVQDAPADDPVTLGFVLMMVRLCGCVSCNADSFRAMRGCSQCARQIVRRYRGGDVEMNGLYQEACHEMEKYLGRNLIDIHPVGSTGKEWKGNE